MAGLGYTGENRHYIVHLGANCMKVSRLIYKSFLARHARVDVLQALASDGRDDAVDFAFMPA